MTISPHFQAEIDEVDPTKTLVFVVNTTTYDDFEWSYIGLTVTGGSELACEYGASALMEAMGFRWYIPETTTNSHFTVRPVSIPTNLTAAKQSYWLENVSLFLVYGHAFGSTLAASRDLLTTSQQKWVALNGWEKSAFPAGHRWSNIVAANIPFFQAHPKLIRGGDPTAAGVKFNLGAGVTITNASPGVVTYARTSHNTHLLVAGDPVTFSTTGVLPSPLAAGTTYYVSATGLTTTAFSVAATPGGAAINTTTDGSGAHILEIPDEDMELLEDLCAAYMLKVGLNLWQRTNFDASDGDVHSSDQVFPFANRVVAKMRAGTAAMAPVGTWPGIPAQTGVSDCAVGLYGYAGHEQPPTNSASPGVYTLVALAFNGTELSFTELIEGHGAKADAVAVREYLDTQIWSQGYPLRGKKDGYFETYNDYKAAGMAAMTTEYSANWFANMVMIRCAIRKFKTGTYTYTQALADLMDDVFDNDPAVEDLLTLWSEVGENYNSFNLARSFDLVDAMAESWYKEYFKYYMVVLHKWDNLPEQTNKADQSLPWINPKTATVTISQASPAVVSWTGHGLTAETPVTFTTTGALPAPIVSGVNAATVDTVYYVQATGLTADAFRISPDPGGADVNTTTAGSGVHTARSRWPRLCPKWAANTVYVQGDWVTNDNWQYYECTVGGTSAASGGPTGRVQTPITDNTVTWLYGMGADGHAPPTSTLPVPPGMEADAYQLAYTDVMKNVTALREYNILHSYAWVRQKANTFVAGTAAHYPWLRSGQINKLNEPAVVKQGVYYPIPDYFQRPELPTNQEFIDAYAAILASTDRDPDLDSEDLAVVRGITPEVTATAPATTFLTRYEVVYYFAGPGQVTTTSCSDVGAITSSSVVNEETYDTGLHRIALVGPHLVTHQGGDLFMDTFPVVWLQPDGTTLDHWLYIPTRFDGVVDLSTFVRVEFEDASGDLTLTPPSHASYVDPENLGPGQVKVINGTSSGKFFNNSVNRYLSLRPDTALMPDAFAVEDFPNRPKVNVVP
jgi:hypothetical protein